MNGPAVPPVMPVDIVTDESFTEDESTLGEPAAEEKKLLLRLKIVSLLRSFRRLRFNRLSVICHWCIWIRLRKLLVR